MSRPRRLACCAVLLLMAGILATPSALLGGDGGNPTPPSPSVLARGDAVHAALADSSPLRRLLSERRAGEAELEIRPLLRQAETRYGSDSPEVAGILELLFEALRSQGRESSDEALAMAQRALAIREARGMVGGNDDAMALLQLGVALNGRQQYDQAQMTLERADALWEERAPGTPLHATALSYLAWNLLCLDQLERAERVSLRSLAMREHLKGDQRADLSWNYGQLAMICRARGDFGRASSFGERSIRLREELLGPDHVWVADARSSHAWLLVEMGQYAAAHSELERSLRIYEAATGETSPRTAWICNDLGAVLQLEGDLLGARAYHERALAIRETTLGAQSPAVAQSLHNLAELDEEIGDLDHAIAREEQVLELLRPSLGEAHVECARAHASLGRLLVRTGQPRRAVEHARAAVHSVRASQGERSPLLAQMKHMLAVTLHDAGSRAEALPILYEALDSLKSTLGPEHPSVAAAWYDLGRFELEAGQLAPAREAAERALAIRSAVYHDLHPDVAASAILLGEVELAQGQLEQARRRALAAEELSRRQSRLLLRGLGESQALAHVKQRPEGISLALSALLDGGRATVVNRAECWDAVIRSRGLVLSEMAARQRQTGKDSDQHLAELREARGRLAHLVMAGPGDLPLPRYGRALELAEQDKERAERALAGTCPAVGIAEEGGLDEVMEALPSRTALIAFLCFDRQHPAGAVAHLAAFATTGRKSSGTGPDPDIHLVDLGPMHPIEQAVERWSREAALGELRADRSARASLQAYVDAGRTVRQLVWDPLAPWTRGVDEIFVVPDGALARLNLAALPDDAEGYLLEQLPPIGFLTRERDLLIPTSAPARRKSEAEGLLAVGGVSFGQVEPATGGAGDATRRTLFDCLPLNGASTPFPELPASREEALTITRLWGERGTAALLTGAEASEGAVRAALVGKRVIHLATHAYWLGPDCVGPERSIPATTLASGEPAVFHSLQSNPLLRCGIALAGANRLGGAGLEPEDGLLTGEEIVGLKLSDTELVVLSGCGTARGVEQDNEGVLGLPRAFALAGAPSAVVTLWPVADRGTLRWMRAFYRSRFDDGSDLARAVRESSLEELQRRRERHESLHPFHWAAFVSVGAGR